ncbi:MAG: DUF6414 family protein, partial [Candidatus Dormibacteraceae bacterium]
SYVAQAAKGLTSERTVGSEHQAGGSANVRGKVPLLMEGSGELDYRYVRSGSETKSLHDHIFTEFDDHVSEQGLVKEFEPASDEWEADSFRDAEFVRVHGPIKVIDYQNSVRMMSILPNLITMATKAANLPRRKFEGLR